jgi:hypothetical protein
MAKRQTKTVVKTTLPAVRRPVVVLDSTQQIIQSILAAASNPRVNTDKFKQLMEMKEHMENRAAKIAFDDALAQMQPELPVIDRKGRIIIKAKDPKTGERTGPVEQKTAYAKWEDIHEKIRPILHKYGFSLSFRTPIDPSGKIAVTGILGRGGHREETTLSFQHDSTGSKNAAQAIVSSTSYGKRVVACLLLNISTRGEDDDGVRSGMLERITQEQLAELIKLADEAVADKARFCAMFKVDSFADIPALRFEEAKAQLMRKLRDKKARLKAAAESDFPGDKPMPKTEPPQNEWKP